MSLFPWGVKCWVRASMAAWYVVPVSGGLSNISFVDSPTYVNNNPLRTVESNSRRLNNRFSKRRTNLADRRPTVAWSWVKRRKWRCVFCVRHIDKWALKYPRRHFCIFFVVYNHILTVSDYLTQLLDKTYINFHVFPPSRDLFQHPIGI